MTFVRQSAIRNPRAGHKHQPACDLLAINYSIEGQWLEVGLGGTGCSSTVGPRLTNRISPRAALIAFAIAMVILAQGISAPFVKDAEPQAASWIQDRTVASGNHILIPRDYYGELAREPPLFYRAAGAITAVTGGRVDEIRARIVSVVAGAAIAVMVLMWTAAFLDLTTGLEAFSVSHGKASAFLPGNRSAVGAISRSVPTTTSASLGRLNPLECPSGLVLEAEVHSMH